jgi:glutathione S-transferase
MSGLEHEKGNAMILFGSTLSPFVRKVMAFAGEKGLEIELKPTGFPGHEPEFCAASPFRKMPALVDGDYCLADSSAIIHYLEAKYPEPALIPAEPRARGRTIWFDEFADTILFGCGQKMFFNRIVSPYFLKRPGDLALAETAERDELPPILDYLETVVPDEGGFLVGDGLTLADIAVAGPFANLAHLGIATDAGRHPRTAAYVKRILARPSFSQWIERESALLAKVGEAA